MRAQHSCSVNRLRHSPILGSLVRRECAHLGQHSREDTLRERLKNNLHEPAVLQIWSVHVPAKGANEPHGEANRRPSLTGMKDEIVSKQNLAAVIEKITKFDKHINKGNIFDLS